MENKETCIECGAELKPQELDFCTNCANMTPEEWQERERVEGGHQMGMPDIWNTPPRHGFE